jgi:hypothetical protein
MTDDIVTRLRQTTTVKDFWSGRDIVFKNNPLCYEAANEIERLRKLVSTWIICAERLVESNDGEEYEQANAFYLECQRIANETCHE